MSRVRITEETLKVLAAIAYLGEATPTQVRRRTDLAPGTIGPILARLQAAGWLAQRQETGEPRELGRPLRTFYRITGVVEVQGMAAGVSKLLTTILEGTT